MLVVGGKSKHLKVYKQELVETTNTSTSSSTTSSRSINVSKGDDKRLVWHEAYEETLDDVAGTGSGVSDMCWSPHTHFLAVCGKKWEQVLVLSYKSLTDTKEYSIKIPNGRYQNCCGFDKTGHTLATGGISGVVYIWKLDTEAVSWAQATSVSNPSLNTINYLSWDPTAAYLCTGDTKGELVIHVREKKDYKSYNFVEKVALFEDRPGPDVEVTALECNPYFPHQPSQVAVGFSDGALRLCDIGTRAVTGTVNTHSSTITDIAYSTLNGMLLATASLDGQIHLIALQTAQCIKTYDCTKPVFSVEFIRGKYPYFVYATQHQIGTYRLREPWQARKIVEVESPRLLRFRSSREPMEETEGAYAARSGGEAAKDKDCKDIAKNKPEFNPHKPSPGVKALSRQDIASSFGAATELSTTPDLPVASPNITEPRTQHSNHGNTAHSVRNISDIQEEEGSFNISDIADYTDRADEDRKYGKHDISELLPGHYNKRSYSGTVKSRAPLTSSTPDLLFPDPAQEHTSPNKQRRVEEEEGSSEEKENKPPCKATPKEMVMKKHRFSSSTPSVSNTKPFPFGTPTSSTNLFSPTVFQNVSQVENEQPKCGVLKSRSTPFSCTPHTAHNTHTSPHTPVTPSRGIQARDSLPSFYLKDMCNLSNYIKKDAQNTTGISESSPSSLIADLRSPPSLCSPQHPHSAVNELSNKLKELGGNIAAHSSGGNTAAHSSGISQSPFLQVPNHTWRKDVSQASSVSQGVLSQAPNTPNPGVVMSTEQMSLIQGMITQGFADLTKTLCSETRWLKNEVVKNTLATEWNLEDKLAGMSDRLSRLEQMCGDLQHDVTTIKNNI